MARIIQLIIIIINFKSQDYNLSNTPTYIINKWCNNIKHLVLGENYQITNIIKEIILAIFKLNKYSVKLFLFIKN